MKKHLTLVLGLFLISSCNSTQTQEEQEMIGQLEANKQLVRNLYGTLMARGDTKSAEEILAETYLDHDIPGHPGDGSREELKQAVLGVRAAFPDIKPELLEILAEGDLVSVRVEAEGTHTGEPFNGIPPRGKNMRWQEIHIFRCQSGKIVEHWGVFDLLGILQQLGAIPQ